MRATITTIAAILMTSLVVQYAAADAIPDWIRNNAAWWAEGSISQADFVSGLQFLIQEDILKVPATQVSENKSDKVPDWVKNNAAWWAEGKVTDADFVNGIQFLMQIGLISVQTSEPVSNASMDKPKHDNSSLQAELEACQEITRAYDRFKCEDAVELKIKLAEYEANSEKYEVGPITVYYPGAEVEIASSGQANLYIQILAKNTRSNDNVILMCSGPSVCNYDVWNGDKAFKYSTTDFTSGQISIKPGEIREINLFFGPNIGYGGTTFEYDSTKDYYFRIFEPWGKADIPLELK